MAKKKALPATPALTPELQQIKDMALAALKPIKRQLYTLGTLYWKVEHEGLAAKAGFTNADDYWLQNIPTDSVGLPTVQLWSRIRIFSSDVCSTYKVTCLDMLVRGLKHQGVTPPEDPGDMAIEFDDEEGHHSKKFRDCSKQDMQHFLHGTAPGEPPPGDLTSQDNQDIANIQRMLSFATLKDKKARISAEVDDDNELMIDIRLQRYWLEVVILALEDWALDRTHGKRPPPAPLQPGPSKRKAR